MPPITDLQPACFVNFYMSDTLRLLSGQVVWAIGQILVVVILTYNNKYEIIGLYTLMLSIFTPLTIAGSFNIRINIAQNVLDGLPVINIYFFRGLVAALSFFLTLLIVFKSFATMESLLISSVLLSSRTVDQLSDISLGIYQRDGRNKLIARSFLLRGLSTIFPFGAIYIATGNIAYSGIGSFFVSLTVFMFVEGRDIVINDKYDNKKGLLISFREIFRKSAKLAFYPLLDNLHFNSFRYAISLYTSHEYMGIIGIAQTVFSPFQLFATAMGFKHYSLVKSSVEQGNIIIYNSLLKKGVIKGIIVTSLFLAIALILALTDLQVTYIDNFQQINEAMLIVAIAMLPVYSTGFVASNLLAAKRNFAYIFNPILGIIIFWTLLFVVVKYSGNSINMKIIIGMVFFLGAVGRLVFAVRCGHRGIEKSETR